MGQNFDKTTMHTNTKAKQNKHEGEMKMKFLFFCLKKTTLGNQLKRQTFDKTTCPTKNKKTKQNKHKGELKMEYPFFYLKKTKP